VTFGGEEEMSSMIKHTLFALVSIVALATAACGGSGSDGSGVDRSKKANSLSADEKMNLCTWSTTEAGGENKTTTCSDGTTVSSGTTAKCLDGFAAFKADCTLTVGQLEDCTKVIAKDPCKGPGADACKPVLTCLAAQ
jgi:hypothetical protein